MFVRNAVKRAELTHIDKSKHSAGESAVANTFDSPPSIYTISILIGAGNGTFATAVNYITGVVSMSIST